MQMRGIRRQMQYVEHDLGTRRRGDQVRVTSKGDAADVQLLDSSQRSDYERASKYQSYGGHATPSPD